MPQVVAPCPFASESFRAAAINLENLINGGLLPIVHALKSYADQMQKDFDAGREHGVGSEDVHLNNLKLCQAVFVMAAIITENTAHKKQFQAYVECGELIEWLIGLIEGAPVQAKNEPS